MIRAAVYVLFFLSGATALVYEVAWTRRLVLLLGSTQVAVSLILAAWMLGLALGAGIAGRRADRARRPLLLYGILEAGVAALALLFPLLLDGARALSLAAGGSRTVAFVAGFGVLLLPTTLMGATLPILSRFVVTALSGMGRRIGLLYGINTFGAVAGTFLAGFFLVRLLGVYGATYAAAAVNIVIAATAISIGLRSREAPRREPAPAETPSVPVGAVILLAALMSGLVSLASEVLWTRMLTFFLEGFTYTFSAMLTTFLLGLAVGAPLSGLIVDRVRNLRTYIGWLFGAAAVVSAGVLLVLTHHFEVTNWAKDVTAGLFPDPEDWRAHHAASLFVASFVVLFPPALVMGGIFPAVARLATRHAGEVGARVGLVYAVNTLGAVAGSLLAGLVLIRTLGMAWGAAAVTLLGAMTALVLLGRRRALFGLPLAAAAVVLVLLAEPGTPFVRHSHVFKGERGLERTLESYREGIYGAVSVVEDRRNLVTAIYTDEFQAAATGPQYRYMRMLAHLPLLLAPKWKGSEVLVICFGTGTTAGSASVHPLGRLDLVEISEDVLAQADRFRHVNKGVLDPEAKLGFPLHVHVDDGRNFLLRSDRHWDVITLEPLMPYTPGAVNLYTEDFYRLCRDRLAEGGLACQWIPIHAMSHDDYRMLVRSFVEVFPDSTLWFVEGTSLVIGTREPLPLEFRRVAERMKSPGIAEDLTAIGFTDPSLVLNAYVTGGEHLRKFVEDALVMSDEHPHMEFRPLPIRWPNSFLADNLAILREGRRPVALDLDLAGLPEPDAKELLETLARFYRGGQAFLAAEHFKARSAYWGTVGRMEEQESDYRDALSAYEEAVRDVPEDEIARYLRANAWYGWWISVGLLELDRANWAKAEEHFEKARALDNPFRADLAWALLGRTMNRQGRHHRALRYLETALEKFPRSPLARAERGFARFRLGFVKEALEDLRAAFDSPVPPEADDALAAVRKQAFQMERKGIVPESPTGSGDAAAIVAALRTARGDTSLALMRELRGIYGRKPVAVRTALAADLARARDPEASRPEQIFALDVLVGLGDLPGTLDLLRTGAPEVRERAADVLARVRKAEVIPALIEAMGDTDRSVREAAWAALFGLTGRRPEDYDPDATEAERAAAVAKLRAWWAEVGPGWRFE